METPADILRALGGPSEIARTLALPPATVIHWGRRGSIPYKHWPAILDMAKRRKVPAITSDALLRANGAA